jgi:hypothetical protein
MMLDKIEHVEDRGPEEDGEREPCLPVAQSFRRHNSSPAITNARTVSPAHAPAFGFIVPATLLPTRARYHQSRT